MATTPTDRTPGARRAWLDYKAARQRLLAMAEHGKYGDLLDAVNAALLAERELDKLLGVTEPEAGPAEPEAGIDGDIPGKPGLPIIFEEADER